jgi:group I intron endonuclease
VSQVIYKIINLVNDKFYVGSTNNKNERFRTHRNKLRRGVHHCAHLQAAWNKYGEEKFDFRVVQNVPDEESLQAAEDVWLTEHVGKQHCYNAGTRSGAPMRGRTGERHPSFGVPVSEEQREQISQTLKEFYAQDYFNHPRVGKQHTEETKAKIGEKVRQAVAEGRGGAFIPSEETRQKMSDALKGNQNAKGYKRSEAEREAIRQRTLGNQNWLGKNHTEEAKDKLRRPVIALLPDGTRREFKGIALAGEELGTPYQMLIRICRDKKPVVRGKFAGWQFFYADEELTPVVIPEEFRHLPRTRQQAKEEGAKQYFTGLPCTHGHLSPRLTKGTCVACRKAGLS